MNIKMYYLIATVIWASGALPVTAEVVFDGSIGPNAAGVTRSGDFTITEADGVVAGSNLFHSFDTFNVNTGESATFTSSGSVENIISRVTGSNITEMDGLISSDASFWLLNPNGITVTDNAVLNIAGSLFLSASSSVLFEDLSSFTSNLPDDNIDGLLTVSHPVDFGFLIDSASIGTLTVNSAQLNVTGANVFLKARNDVLISDTDFLAFQTEVYNPNRIEPDAIWIESFVGSVDMFSSDPDKRVEINNQFFELENALSGRDGFIVDNNYQFDRIPNPTYYVFDLNITALKDISLTNLNFEGESRAVLEDLKAGNLSIKSKNGEVAMRNVSIDTASQESSMRSGDIIIKGAGFVADNVKVFSKPQGVDRGGPGHVLIDINGEDRDPNISFVNSLVSLELAGDTDGYSNGEITLVASGDILLDGSALFGNTRGDLEGSPIALMSLDGSVILNDTRLDSSSESYNLPYLNHAGDISLSAAQKVELLDGSIILSESGFEANGGKVRAVGNNGTVSISAPLIIVDSSEIRSRNNTTHLAGEENQYSELSNIISISTIATNQRNNASRKYDKSGIFIRDSIITSESFDDSASSDILFYGGSDITLKSSIISAAGNGEGNAGDIALSADKIKIDDGSQLSSSSTGSGAAGDITINKTNRLEITKNKRNVSIEDADGSDADAAILTSSSQSGGGNVTIKVKDYIAIVNSDIVTKAAGDGGNISIDPQLLFFDSARLNSSAVAGNGGQITVQADQIIRSQDTVFDSRSQAGVDGEIAINGVTNEVGQTETISVDYADASSLLSQKCHVEDLADRSSFIVAGNMGQRHVPGAYQLSSLKVGQSFAASSNAKGNSFFITGLAGEPVDCLRL